MTNNAPYTVLQDTGSTLSLVLVKLVVSQSLQGQACGEQSDCAHLNNGMVAHQDSSLVSKRSGKWQTDQHLEEGLGQESSEEGFDPEVGFLLDLLIPRIVLATLDGAAGDAVEKTTTPKRYTSQHKALMPRETMESLRKCKTLEQTTTDGGPPSIHDLSAGPEPVLCLDALCVVGGAPSNDGEARVQAQRGRQGISQNADVEERSILHVQLGVRGVSGARGRGMRQGALVGARKVEVVGLTVTPGRSHGTEDRGRLGRCVKVTLGCATRALWRSSGGASPQFA